MAVYFCDTVLTTGDNNGTTMDNAYQSIKTAMEITGRNSGDILWIRRRSSFSSPTSDIAPPAPTTSTSTSPVEFRGWARSTWAIASSDWTQGSTAVTVDDANMTRGHLGRYITGPDTKRYLITRVISSSSIVIDCPYVGTTVTNQAATIHADEDYASAQSVDDSTWTIKKTDWNADSELLPTIDFGANAYQLYFAYSGPYSLKYIDFLNSTDTLGTVYYVNASKTWYVLGCLFKQTQNAKALACMVLLSIDRCIFEGSSTGTNQRMLYNGYRGLVVKNSAMYGSGGVGAELVYYGDLINCNIGVEVANVSVDLYGSDMRLFDVKCGGTNGLISMDSVMPGKPLVMFEDYGKVVGSNKAYFGPTEWTSDKPVVSGSGDPYKRTDGADSVLQILNNRANSGERCAGLEKIAMELRFWADTTAKSYRLYCQSVNLPTLTSAQAFIRCEYIDSYVSSSVYTKAYVVSTQSIVARSSASDWSQYIEVTGIQPVVAGLVTIRLMVQWNDADGYLYVDPLSVVS